MADGKNPAQDMFSQWLSWQQSFWQNWTEAATKGMEMFMPGSKEAEDKSFMEMHRKWMKAFQEALGGAAFADVLPARGVSIASPIFPRILCKRFLQLSMNSSVILSLSR